MALAGAALVAMLAAGGGRLAVDLGSSRRVRAIHHHTGDQHGERQVAAISPDGKFIVDVQRGPDGESLWLRNIDTGSHTQVVPPQPVLYGSVAFSPDGNYIYSRLAVGRRWQRIQPAARARARRHASNAGARHRLEHHILS